MDSNVWRTERLASAMERTAKELKRMKGRERSLKNELKALEHNEKELERKRRNRRIFTRGGMLEAFLQKPLLLSDEQVYALLKVIFHKPEVDDLLKRMIAESERKLLEDADPAGDPTE